MEVVERPPSRAPDKFAWDGKESYWVMGALTSNVLKDMMDSDPIPVRSSPSTIPRSVETRHIATSRRRRCGFKEGCICRRLDPMVFLPEALLDDIEFTSVLLPMATNILDTCEGLAPEDAHQLMLHTEESGPSASKFREMAAGRMVYYMVRPEHRAAAVEEAGRFREASAMARLDAFQYDANMVLLPELLKFSAEYRAVKLALFAESSREDNELRDRVYAGGTPSPALVALMHERGEGKTYPSASELVAKEAQSLPKLLCRCGHAEVWHEKPDDLMQSLKESSLRQPGLSFRTCAEGPAAAAAEVASPPRSEVPARRTPSPELPVAIGMSGDAGRRAEATLRGGRLVLQGAAASMLSAKLRPTVSS